MAICDFGCGSLIFLCQFPTVIIVSMTSFVSDKRLGGAAAYRGEKIMTQGEKKRTEDYSIFNYGGFL